MFIMRILGKNQPPSSFIQKAEIALQAFNKVGAPYINDQKNPRSEFLENMTKAYIYFTFNALYKLYKPCHFINDPCF